MPPRLLHVISLYAIVVNTCLLSTPTDGFEMDVAVRRAPPPFLPCLGHVIVVIIVHIVTS